ncbi:hypothetical protein GCM10011371_12150 [Novosphingobium marinum]|uniref:Glycosyltransferase RgtA/B/C/D-like domain-containing protein n=1 Tax=Novosphingobium marinum TaxID=1514948 RepID=A0A7Y9XVF9_9SPHN|nr:hypothetical protein [Novosphingobium marinum]NYH95324.1 hypothetical protein [Novosphingobium marinum]GGC26152.1 hypothetical protein GCM10011371_12150 [Novosphingobium marinum]
MNATIAAAGPETIAGETPAPTRARALHPAAVFAILLVVAVALRFDTFGDPNLHGDEVFYHTVGIAMHHGAVPYVDVWDRKPFGLFVLFWLIAAFSEAPLAYQIAATLFAAGTAWCIAAMARSWTGAQGALLAGVVYLLWLAPLQGFGGQSPVFYNLFIAGAALLVWRALPALREGRVPRSVLLAMLVAGAGITLKTTALFEAAFLGLLGIWTLWRAGVAPRRLSQTAVTWAAIGAAPALAIALGYAAIGHWPEYWHAMVTSNLDKQPHLLTSLVRGKFMALALAPVALLAILGLARQERDGRRFTLLWLAAGIVGLVAVPNFYLHYAIPLLVPLCLAASAFLSRGVLGIGAVIALAVFGFQITSPFQYGHAAQSRAAIERLAQGVREHVGSGPLLLYDAPPQLYRLTGQPMATPLVFPTHLSHDIERDTSHLSTLGETKRVLALRPGAVVMAHPLRNGPVNEQTHRRVLAYVGENCRLVDMVRTPERQRTDTIAVWGDCRR